LEDIYFEKKVFCIVIAALMLITSISGCSQSSDEVSTTVSQTDSDCPYDEFIVVDVFDSMANFQGLQSGWFAEIVKQKFNMELNIIAPNVTGGGDTLYEMRSAAGNLGDLIICTSENGRLQDLVSSGLLLDMNRS
jgi:multiple sugar transport system substrate-binding protein/putative aldouronate transport system substrate-binding protein